MESLYILIPISILLAFFIGYFFWWSGKSGQFDDERKFFDGALYDDEDALNEAADLRRREKEARERGENDLEKP